MISLDTNVWVRYVTNDDPVQAQRALRLLEDAEGIFIPKTILLEMEWVLRAVYELPPASILKSLRQILGLSNVHAEAAGQVAKALELYEQGFDFADALHLSGSEQTECFYTFDSRFIAKAKKTDPEVREI